MADLNMDSKTVPELVELVKNGMILESRSPIARRALNQLAFRAQPGKFVYVKVFETHEEMQKFLEQQSCDAAR